MVEGETGLPPGVQRLDRQPRLEGVEEALEGQLGRTPRPRTIMCGLPEAVDSHER